MTTQQESNFQRVLEYFRANPCTTQKQCAEALEISRVTVSKHVKKIRAETARLSRG
jgi:biotin operon repressor